MNWNTSLFSWNPLALIHTTEAQEYNNPISEEERLVTEALDVLEATGALQRSNWMDITELLNPVAKSSHVFDVGNKDIFQAVMDTKVVQESSKGHDGNEVSTNGNNDCDEPTKPPPIWKEALQVMMVLCRYANEMGIPLVCKVEVVLGSFRWMTQVHEMKSMKDKKLISYFTHK